MTLTKGQR